jgi:hypothetical protein
VEPAARPPNPFDDYIVTDPWQTAVTDVPEIHASAYALCCQARDHVCRENKTTSVLLHGQIGSGKTHLLARLRKQWTVTTPESFTTPPPGILFIAHRFAPSPTRIWRQLRRSLVNDLLRPDSQGSCQLQRLLLRQLARVRPADTYLPHWWEYMQLTYAGEGDLERELGSLFDKLDQECDLGRSLCTMLLRFILDRQGRDVRDWLRGAALPDETLVALGLPRAPDEPEDHEAEARDFILALSRLAGPDHPLVICFDQIEALQVHPKDQAGLFAFGQLVAALHDQTSNVLMISCVQSSFLLQLRQYVAGQNYNRLAKYEGSLDLLNWDQAVSLIKARLDSLVDLAHQRRGHPDQPLWPLPEEHVQTAFRGQASTAREVLTHCSQLLGALPPPSLLDFLTTAWAERVQRSPAAADPDQVDAILSDGLPLLFHVVEKNAKLIPAHEERDLDFVLEAPEGRIGLSLCNHRSMHTLAARFRRLADSHVGPQLSRLIVLRDPRWPIRKSARQTRNYLKELKRAGAGYLEPSAQVLANLDALRSLLSDAKSGDLANAGEAVAPATVEDWIANNFPRLLRDFLAEILSPPLVSTREARTEESAEEIRSGR